MIPHLSLVWSNFCIYGFMLLFSFSIFSDRGSLKIENENNSTKTPIYRNMDFYPGWLELTLTGINFHGPKPVRATKVLHGPTLYCYQCTYGKIIISILRQRSLNKHCLFIFLFHNTDLLTVRAVKLYKYTGQNF